MAGNTDADNRIKNDQARSSSFLHLIAIIITGLAFFVFLVVPPAANATDATTTTGDQVCEGLDSGKIDTTGNPQTVTVTAPEGMLIDGYCIKAGSTNNENGPVYVTVNPPAKTVTISYPGGKDISHYSVSYIDAPDVKVPVPAKPSMNDPCGHNNATWVKPADTASVMWVLEADGDLVASTKPGYVFEDGTTSKNYGKATDSNEPCTTPPPPVTDVCPGMPGTQPPGTVCTTPPPPPVVDVCPNMPGNQPVGTVCTTPTPTPTPEPATKNKGSVYGSCVTPTRGEGVAKGRVTNAHSTRVTVKQNGKVVKTRVVAAGARFRMEMNKLQVGSAVSLFMGGKFVDRDMVENDCVLPPHVGLKTAAATKG